MSLTVKEHRNFLPVPEGSHIARCCALIDLGMQYSKFYDNTLPKVTIGWELINKLTEEEKPYVHFQRYTASLNAKSFLRTLLEGWRGHSFTSAELTGFELKEFLGTYCYLTIQPVLNLQTQQRWLKVVAISPLPHTMSHPPAIHQLIYFDLDSYSERDYLSVPESIRKHINIPTSTKTSSTSKQKSQIFTKVSRFYPLHPDEPQPDVDS